MKPACIIARLERLEPLFALDFTQSSDVWLRQEMLACCKGTGVVDQGELVYQCSIKKKLAGVKAIVSQFKRCWKGKTIPSSCTNLDKNLLWSTLKNYKTRRSDKGNVIHCSPDQPSDLWYVALVACWNFGLPVHVVSIGATPVEKLLPEIKNEVGLVLLENVAGLSDLSRLRDFETILDFSFGAQFPLWLAIPRMKVQVNRRDPAYGILKQRMATSPLSDLDMCAIQKLSHTTFVPKKLLSNH